MPRNPLGKLERDLRKHKDNQLEQRNLYFSQASGRILITKGPAIHIYIQGL